MLLAVKNEIAKPMSLLFNRSIQEIVFPDQWKIAHVMALFIKGDTSLPSNYRPVSSERTFKHLQSKSGKTLFSSFELDMEEKYLFKISAFSMDSYDNLKSFCGSYFLKIASICIPTREVIIRNDDKVWFDSTLRREIRKREFYFYNFYYY
jgi:hypothetical protein